MRKHNLKKSKKVLVFNGAKVLIAVCRSLHSASLLSGGNTQAISFACTGKYISTGGFYYRHIHPDIEIELDDLDNLKLQDYDRMCNYTDRKYYTIKQMAKMRSNILARKNIKTITDETQQSEFDI